MRALQTCGKMLLQGGVKTLSAIEAGVNISLLVVGTIAIAFVLTLEEFELEKRQGDWKFYARLISWGYSYLYGTTSIILSQRLFTHSSHRNSRGVLILIIVSCIMHTICIVNYILYSIFVRWSQPATMAAFFIFILYKTYFLWVGICYLKEIKNNEVLSSSGRSLSDDELENVLGWIPSEGMAPSRVWSDAETSAIIELYGEYHSELEKMKKKKPIYEKIAEKLNDQGFSRDGSQVSKKIANLRSSYKNNQPGPTGDEPSKWSHYEAMHKILHERPSLNTAVAKTSEIGFPELLDFVPENSENPNEDDIRQRSQSLEDETSSDEIPEVICDENETTKTPSGDGDITPKITPTRPAKRAKLSEQIVTLCSQTLNFMKSESNKREKERDDLKSTNSLLMHHLDRIATSSELMAKSMQNPICIIQEAENK